jgi:TolA-binding protein
MNLRARGLLLLLPLLALSAGAPAWAQLLTTPQWATWADNGQAEELARAAEARLRSQPDDAEALVAHALALLAEGDLQQLGAAEQSVRRCIQRQPQQAICYAAMATVQGLEIVEGGALKAISLAGPIRSNLLRALELDPLLFSARVALLQFYVKVPAVAGGGMAKARELAQAAQQRQPEHAKLLFALLAGHDKHWDEMERALQSVKAGNDAGLNAALRDGWYELGMQFVFDQHFARAKAIFEHLQRDYPGHAIGPFGLARLAAAEHRFDESGRQFERARGLAGAQRLPLDYRLGLMLMEKGDKAQARVALQRFVEHKRGAPKNLDDARKRLAELGEG